MNYNDINNYIGIPYEFAGWSHEGADCIGLCRLFYHEHQWKPELYDGTFEKDWWKKTPLRMVRWFVRNMTPIKNPDELQYGDIMYFHINGEGHVGIYIEYGKMLTTYPPECRQWDGTVFPHESMLIPRRIWKQGFKCGFRRRDN